MSRILLFIVMVVGLILVFTTRSQALLWLGLAMSIIGFIGFVLALLSARVSANARPEGAILSVDDLARMRGNAPRRMPPVNPAGDARTSPPLSHTPPLTPRAPPAAPRMPPSSPTRPQG